MKADTGAKGVAKDWWTLHVMEYTSTAGAYAANVGALSVEAGGTTGWTKKA